MAKVTLSDGREIEYTKIPAIESGECVFHSLGEGRLELIFLRDRASTEIVARVVLSKEATPGFLLSMKKVSEFLQPSPPERGGPKPGH